ncbi:SNF-related serine/threonine-protein kinase [Hydra vulgaris]|uniref:SNF-related serine/threonine-protein kinase n=1 Tax=Hydra vulgaris TaxID=6087 RepID=UPI001F5E5D29|nr:SNF-related serine/threonine-protein kinase [Hydra vulgaris]
MEPQADRMIRAKPDKNIAGLYDMERSLGSGHFAVVKLARHVFTGEKVAVKVIDKSKLDGVAKSHLYQEVRCMKLVQHPNIVRLYEVIDTQTKLYLILEYGDGGDMYDHIMRYEGQGISEAKACHYFRQILSAIDYCHKLHVVHRDLKPENVIFFKSQDIAKLTDFGFSNSFMPGEKLYTSCGSLAYSAPEILLGDSYDAPAVDVWSLGVILYMMVCGKGPFNHANDSETLTMIMDCRYDLPSTLSSRCKSLISRMLVRQPSSRASIANILDDPWLSESSLPKMMTRKPLISEVNIPSEIHSIVLKKMENGNISTREQIEKSLREKAYNHIAATYFLLAERALKKIYVGAFHVKNEGYNMFSSSIARSTSQVDCPTEITQDDSIEVINYPITNDLTREHSQSDECLVSESSHDDEFQIKPLQPRTQRLTYPSSIYTKQNTKSSSNLLNEISEEHHSADESPRSSPLQRRASQRRRQYHACRLSPIHSRRSSCSSSDDEELHLLTERRRRSGLGLQTLQTSFQSLNTFTQNTSGNCIGKQNFICSQQMDKKTDLENFFLSSLNSNLSKQRTSYGRYLSDTNLTSRYLQLHLAILNKKKDKMVKSSSDTNLSSTVLQDPHNIFLTSQFIKNKDLFLKGIKRSSINSSSFSSPIEEEPPNELSNSHPLTEGNISDKSHKCASLSKLSESIKRNRKQYSDSDLSIKSCDAEIRFYIENIINTDRLSNLSKIVSVYTGGLSQIL